MSSLLVKPQHREHKIGILQCYIPTAVMSLDEPRLPLQAEKVLPHAIRPHLLAYCSRTDLFAVVNDEEIADVYRLGGQKAFSVRRKSPSITVVGLEWIRDGLFMQRSNPCARD